MFGIFPMNVIFVPVVELYMFGSYSHFFTTNESGVILPDEAFALFTRHVYLTFQIFFAMFCHKNGYH